MRRNLDGPTRKTFASDEKGVAAVEFALLGLPFFVLIFSLIEIGLIFAGELVLDNAVDGIGRQLRTGQIQAIEPTREDFVELVCDRVEFLMDCSKLRVDLASFGDYAAVGTAPSGEPRFQMGSGSTLMALTVQYDWPIYTHVLRAAATGRNGQHPMSAIAAFRSEAF